MALSSASAAIVTAAAEPAGEVAALTRRLVAAEDAAWTEAHGRYAPRLFRYLLVATHGDEQAAREALQGAFIRAVRHARVFESEEALWGWLTLLARHTLADARRSTTRWRRFLARFTSAVPTPALMTGEADPLPGLLEAALAALSESDRLLLEQKYFTAASIREIAEAFGSTEKAIESRLTRARSRLRETILLNLRS
jgi:RNA polymerase sigma-70 factor (ECF subfamily)